MKILFAAAEVAPLARVGGLADVAGSLPQALARLGHEVRVFLPRYRSIDRELYPLQPEPGRYAVSFLARTEPATLERAAPRNGVTTYLIANDHYFDRLTIYGQPDDVERFLFCSQAITAAPRWLGWQPDIFHCHDWHTGFVPLLLKQLRQQDSFYDACASVFTIHNLGYQGAIDQALLQASGLAAEPQLASPGAPSFYPSGMALGVLHADVVSTVSETYAHEILTPAFGAGLDPLLGYRRERLFGIVNGIDQEEFNPARDPFIATTYDAFSLERKAANKAALQERMGLPQEAAIPLIGMVSRLADQKGFDILEKALPTILTELKVQFVLLGTGLPGTREEHYIESFRQMPSQYPGQAAITIAFDNPLSHLIYAGSDLFLMPSLYEPCGLGQLISLRYGTVPIVRRVGGLAETVQDYDAKKETGTGFVFERYAPEDLGAAVKRAVALFTDKEKWHRLRLRGMAADYSWGASAKKYEALYQKALGFRLAERNSRG